MTTGGEDRAGRWRAVASGVAARVGGLPATRALVAVFAVFDRAGGGLAAGGLAYAALFALLPGLLLALSVVGLLVGDPATRERLVEDIGVAVPPIEAIARVALDQVVKGAVPTGIVAFVGLVWGSSRFYTALDRAFAPIFDDARIRSEVERTARGLVLTVLVVVLPAALLLGGSVVAWVVDVTPDPVGAGDAARSILRLAEPVLVVAVFIAVTGLVYRFVPARRVPLPALRRPAIVTGLALAAFTQAFAVVMPRIVGSAALYGAFVAVFAVLIWLSLGFNVLLLGAAWTRVRELRCAAGSPPG